MLESDTVKVKFILFLKAGMPSRIGRHILHSACNGKTEGEINVNLNESKSSVIPV